MFSRKLKLLTAAPLLAVLALACGPVATPGQGTDTQEAETPAEAGTPTATIQPTRTPYPTDYVKPTDLPTHTPWPTLPDPPTPEPTEPVQHSPGPTLAEQVTQYARDRKEDYHLIARVRVLSHNIVTIPEDIEWPPLQNPSIDPFSWDRTRIRTVEVYHGEWSDSRDLVSLGFRPNLKLDIDQEYILFILKVFASKDEHDDGRVLFLFNEEHLKAVGGKGGSHWGDQVWIVDGDRAWRVPPDHMLTTDPASSDLAAAKAGGESLPLPELVAAIAAAFE